MLGRTLEVAAAAALLLVLSPLLIAIGLAIRFTIGAPVLYMQTRRGLHGREFTILKFRTLRDVPGEPCVVTANVAPYPLFRAERDARATCLGRFLRRHYLDELPQLLNVLMGDMSLVGPRPLRCSEVDALPLEEVAIRERVPPGITGLWQTSPHRYDSLARLFELDRRYCAEATLRSDAAILLRTVRAVVLGTGG